MEIQATPRPGTAVAADDGIVVVIDTTLTDDLRAEGDARELTRALQDLRRQAELALDARIEVWLDADAAILARLEPHLDGVAADVLADAIHPGRATRRRRPMVEVSLDAGTRPHRVARDHRARYAHDEPRAPPPRRASLRLWLVFGAIALVVVALDQASKAWVESSFALVSRAMPRPARAGAPTPVLGDLVRIARSENDGGIFGMLGDSAPVLGIASLAVIAVIVWVQARQGVHSLLLTVALGAAPGWRRRQPLDRLRYGHVVDWVDTGIGDMRFYTFNVADSAISIAVRAAARHRPAGTRLGWRRVPARTAVQACGDASARRTARSPTVVAHEHRGAGRGARGRIGRPCGQVRGGCVGHLAGPGPAAHLRRSRHPRRGAHACPGRAAARCRSWSWTCPIRCPRRRARSRSRWTSSTRTTTCSSWTSPRAW